MSPSKILVSSGLQVIIVLLCGYYPAQSKTSRTQGKEENHHPSSGFQQHRLPSVSVPGQFNTSRRFLDPRHIPSQSRAGLRAIGRILALGFT
jgi:hypothetical protein